MTMTTAIPMRDYFGIWSLSLLASVFLFLATLSGREFGTQHRNNNYIPILQSLPRQHLPVQLDNVQIAFPERPVPQTGFLSDIVSVSRVPAQSLTAILPVSPASSVQLPLRLLALMRNSSSAGFESLHEIIIVCPDTITNSLRATASSIFSSQEFQDRSLPDISLHPFRESLHYANIPKSGNSLYHAAIKVAQSSVSTAWVLMLDENALDKISPLEREILLNPPVISSAAGISGSTWTDSPSVPSQWGLLLSAKYLKTPFVASLVFLRSTRLLISAGSSHVHLRFVANHTERMLDRNYTSGDLEHSGGLVLIKQTISHINRWQDVPPVYPGGTEELLDVMFFILSSEMHVRTLSPLICHLRSAKPVILLYQKSDNHTLSAPTWTRTSIKEQCTIHYDVLTLSMPSSDEPAQSILYWIKATPHANAVILATGKENVVSVGLKNTIRTSPTVIFIPEDNLPYCDWIASLSVVELKNWHIPKVEISVVTKDRPRSLKRLVSSLVHAQYFGDRMDLRFSIEQDCDSDTLKIVKNLSWSFGSVFVHHRVLHAGLLPAVVEAWYPKDDDTYGVILEDDIEVSPMFYAWIKMALLKYRYGAEKNKTPYLFGISLYQHKHMELRTQGRKAFNPRSFFKDAGLTHPSTPYLSQVPCSWGALYFPEHWREFHDYLSVRLAHTIPQLKTEQPIVQNVRSNYWSQSWKKFFIELVYLRGYLMLYPNFPDFVSLSTNHLEVGSHVKSRSQARKDLFTLPLMQPRQVINSTSYSTGLLQLPNKRLPHLPELPMINLTGTLITSHTQLIEAGQNRRRDRLNCTSETEIHDVQSLMCINDSLAL